VAVGDFRRRLAEADPERLAPLERDQPADRGARRSRRPARAHRLLELHPGDEPLEERGSTCSARRPSPPSSARAARLGVCVPRARHVTPWLLREPERRRRGLPLGVERVRHGRAERLARRVGLPGRRRGPRPRAAAASAAFTSPWESARVEAFARSRSSCSSAGGTKPAGFSLRISRRRYRHGLGRLPFRASAPRAPPRPRPPLRGRESGNRAPRASRGSPRALVASARTRPMYAPAPSADRAGRVEVVEGVRALEQYRRPAAAALGEER